MKPTFLSKKEREELALQRLQQQREQQEAKKKEMEIAHQNFISGKNIEDRKREERLQHEREIMEKERRQKEESKESVELDHEVKAIREHYLGGGEKKRRLVKPSEKFTRIFQFEWEDTDDTGRNDLNPLYNKRTKINALFGRGYIAGVDQKQQRKESNFLISLSEKRALEAEESNSNITEEEKKQRAKARAEELRQLQAAMDNDEDNDVHWSDKTLKDMTDRDWRIFREDYDIRIQGGRATLPIRYWKEANLPSEIMKAIEVVNYIEPSPIQRQAIPIGLAKRDIIGIAETGSGKTAAFLIPLLSYLLQMPKHYIYRCDREGPLAIVMAPTRELAIQIEEECIKLAKFTKFSTVSIVGGQSIEEQGYKLRIGVQIVIGTPGRMVDCIEHNYLVLNQCNYVVLDEADRMVDMGFESQVTTILDAMGGLLKSEDEEQAELQLKQQQLLDSVMDVDDSHNNDSSSKYHHNGSNHSHNNSNDNVTLYRVTAMFSATMPPQVEQIAKTYLRHPVMIRIGDEDSGKNKRIEQRVLFITEGQKKSTLNEELRKLSKEDDKVIVFTNSKKLADNIGWNLESQGYAVGVLHGGKSQDQRESTLDMFRKSEITILVATDVAGRGLDIPDVSVVINYECPSKIENYCHRIGRTGRAGRSGVAISFITDSDTEIMYELKNYLESTNAAIPMLLAKHPAAQAAVGTRDEKGKLLGTKKESVMYAKK